MEITNYNVYNLENAIKASKYPMASDTTSKDSEITKTVRKLGAMKRGSGHDNFLHGILVSFDLTCSNKMWIEFERYHFADIVSGQSTMHRITKLAERNIFNEYVVDETKEVLKIQSPSKVMEDEVGEMIPAGVSGGVASNIV